MTHLTQPNRKDNLKFQTSNYDHIEVRITFLVCISSLLGFVTWTKSGRWSVRLAAPIPPRPTRHFSSNEQFHFNFWWSLARTTQRTFTSWFLALREVILSLIMWPTSIAFRLMHLRRRYFTCHWHPPLRSTDSSRRSLFTWEFTFLKWATKTADGDEIRGARRGNIFIFETEFEINKTIFYFLSLV